MRVLPDLSGIDRAFDYSVPERLAREIRVGTIVRVPLQGRRVRGWVVETGAAAPSAVPLRDVAEVVSLGPEPGVVELARWGAWRYSGRLRPLLSAASPPRTVHALPPPCVPGAGADAEARQGPVRGWAPALAAAARQALSAGRAVVRLPPLAPRLELVLALVGGDRRRSALVLVPERHDVEVLSGRLERAGLPVARYPEQWAEAAAGGRVVVGSRAAALASLGEAAVFVVLDAHDDAYVETRVPTWSAPVLVARRAARAGAPCVLVSPCPTLEQLRWGRLVTLSRALERAGWPPVEVVDRSAEDPRAGRYSPRLAPAIASARAARPDLPVVCVLNRTGRARLLACAACGELRRCERCHAPLAEREDEAGRVALGCARCGAGAEPTCPRCGGTRLRLLGLGVKRVGEELAALTGRSVAEVSGRAARRAGDLPEAEVLVGTEAVLHRARAASLVVFLDIDAELLAPRFRAAEQALALIVRAARLLGRARRGPGGPTPRLIVQTRLPGDEVLRSVERADPGILATAELARREALDLPPWRALAALSGAQAAELAAALEGSVEVARAAGGRYLVRAPDPEALADALADALGGAGKLGAKVRVEVDPRDA